jgi:hypothetical protein
MKALFKLSEKAGLAPTVIGALAWIACGKVGVIAIPDALWQYSLIFLKYVDRGTQRLAR